mgnify:CR=1 FL=1|jgi:hypothetical protein
MKPIMITTERGMDNWTKAGQYQVSKTQMTTSTPEVVLEYNTDEYEPLFENGKFTVRRKD